MTVGYSPSSAPLPIFVGSSSKVVTFMAGLTNSPISEHVLYSLLLAISTDILLSRFFEPPTLLVLGCYSAANAALFAMLSAADTAPSLTVFGFKLSVNAALQLAFDNAVFLFVFAVVAAVRRLWFHPLSRFPGRKMAAVSGFVDAAYKWSGKNAIMYALIIQPPFPPYFSKSLLIFFFEKQQTP